MTCRLTSVPASSSLAPDDGSCAGLPITDRLLQQLADMRSSGNIVPFPSITVQKRTINNCEMMVVAVAPSVAYHQFGSEGARGFEWGREGPLRLRKRSGEETESAGFSIDLRPVGSANVQDLILRVFIHQYLPSASGSKIWSERTHPRATVGCHAFHDGRGCAEPNHAS